MFDRDNIRTLEGRTAYGSDGEKIGQVGQIFLDDHTDEPTWITVSTGLFGLSESFVPLQGADVDDEGNLRVAYTKDVVKDAPRVDPEGHLDSADQDELFRYYQATGYDAERYGVGTGEETPSDRAGSVRDRDRQDWDEQLPGRDTATDVDANRADRPVAETSDSAAMAGRAAPLAPQPEITNRVRLRRHEATPEGALGREGEVVPEDSTRLDDGPGPR